MFSRIGNQHQHGAIRTSRFQSRSHLPPSGISWAFARGLQEKDGIPFFNTIAASSKEGNIGFKERSIIQRRRSGLGHFSFVLIIYKDRHHLHVIHQYHQKPGSNHNFPHRNSPSNPLPAPPLEGTPPYSPYQTAPAN
jgi:hypothetical protein